MNKPIKITVSVLLAITLLLTAAVAFLSVMVDPNDFKPEIEAAAQDALGRELTIEGNLKLSLFPWLGFETGRIALGNAQGFNAETFAEVSHGEIKVKLLPLLLFQRLEIKQLSLKRLTVHLEKNAQGAGNWEGLVNDEKAGRKIFNVSKLAMLAAAGLRLEDARITWDDRQSGQHYSVTNLGFEIGKFAFNTPVPLAISVIVSSNEGWQDRLALNAKVSIDESKNHIDLRGLRLKNRLQTASDGGHELKSLFAADAGFDIAHEALQVNGLKFTLGALALQGELAGEKMLSQPTLRGALAVEDMNLRQWLTNDLRIAVPNMRDGKALQHFAARFSVDAGRDFIALRDLSARLDDTALQGQVQVDNPYNPFIRADLALDSIQIDRYFAPEAQTNHTKIRRAKPPLNKLPPQAMAAAPGLLSLDAIRHLQMQSILQIAELKTTDFSLGGVHLELKANQGTLELRHQIKRFFQGQFAGVTTVNAANDKPLIDLSHHFTGIAVEPMLRAAKQTAKVNGLLSGSYHLQSQGNTLAELKAGLNGKGQILLKDTVIESFDLQKILDQGKALLKNRSLPKLSSREQNAFSEVRGSFKIINGILHNNDLSAVAPKLQVNGKGTANLVTERLAYRLFAHLREHSASVLGSIKETPIVIDVGGTFAEPLFTLNVSETVTEDGKEKIEQQKQKLLKKLDKRLGSKVEKALRKLFH